MDFLGQQYCNIFYTHTEWPSSATPPHTTTDVRLTVLQTVQEHDTGAKNVGNTFPDAHHVRHDKERNLAFDRTTPSTITATENVQDTCVPAYLHSRTHSEALFHNQVPNFDEGLAFSCLCLLMVLVLGVMSSTCLCT